MTSFMDMHVHLIDQRNPALRLSWPERDAINGPLERRSSCSDAERVYGQ